MSKKNKRAKKGNHLEEKDLGKVTGGLSIPNPKPDVTINPIYQRPGPTHEFPFPRRDK